MSQKRPDGGYHLEEVQGLALTEIKLNGLVVLTFGEGEETMLHIERDFTVWTLLNSEGAKVEFRPYLSDWAPSGMQELVQLYRSVVVEAEADPDASLSSAFTNGNRLHVEPDPQYEAWGFWFPDGGWLGQPAGSGFT